jgi:hypothetical protein
MKLNKALKLQNVLVLQLATDLNFYGKKLRDKRIEVAENIIDELQQQIGSEIDGMPSDLVAWLDENKPAKPAKAAKAAKAATKPAANTLEAGHTTRQQLPRIETLDRVIVTSAQNNTEINTPAWQALQAFASEMQAQILILPVYYNKTAFSPSAESEGEYFAEALRPFMVLQDSAIFDGLVTLAALAAVVPTAKLPVNAASTLNAGELVTLVGSPKQQLKTLVSSPSLPTREAWSTGTITNLNYTRSRAGSEASADHTFGGILLDISPDGRIYSSNLVYKNGAIQHYLNDDQAVFVLGDLHCEMKDQDNWERTLDLLDFCNPSLIVVHDILHFSTRSHHNRNDGKHLYQTKDQRVLDDLKTVIVDLNTLAEIAPVYVVESNHNSALDNWLHDLGYNPKRDPHQAKFYYLLNWLVCDALDDGNGQIALQVALENLDKFEDFPELSGRIEFGRMDQSFTRYGYELSAHGHKGQNGSAGSTSLFSRWGLPMVTGHTHSPAILGSCVTVGVTASMQQGYNRGGGSSWQQSHAAVLPNGTAQIVPMRGLKELA